MEKPWVSLKAKVVRSKIKTNGKFQNYILYNFMEKMLQMLLPLIKTFVKTCLDVSDKYFETVYM